MTVRTSAVVALVAGLCVATPAGHSAAGGARPMAPSCQGEPATIIGTSGKDRLVGTRKRDVIAGLAGNDRIDGRGGPDLICGGEGADRLFGGPGDDELYGERDGEVTDRGGTRLVGDRLDGGVGDDFLDPGHDSRHGGSQWQQVLFSSSDAAVTVDLGSTPATAVGQGTDELVVLPGTLVVGSDGDDTFLGSDSNDDVVGGPGDDTATLGPGMDTFTDGFGRSPDSGDDVVDGGPGPDTLESMSGSDELVGGPGRDNLYAHADVSVTMDAGGGRDALVFPLARTAGGSAQGGSGRDEIYLHRPDETDSGPVPSGLEVPHVDIDVRAGTLEVGWEAGAVELGLVSVEAFSISDNVSLDFHGSDADEVLTGPAYHPLRAWLGGGDDVATGGQARDQIDGGDGHDEAYGAGGRDTCVAVEVEHSC